MRQIGNGIEGAGAHEKKPARGIARSDVRPLQICRPDQFRKSTLTLRVAQDSRFGLGGALVGEDGSCSSHKIRFVQVRDSHFSNTAKGGAPTSFIIHGKAGAAGLEPITRTLSLWSPATFGRIITDNIQVLRSACLVARCLWGSDIAPMPF